MHDLKCILVAWLHIWSKKTKNINVFLNSFPIKIIYRYLINNKMFLLSWRADV
jgi:hypothetical protein